MPAILLVRHGQASFGGPDYDVLSPTGHEQSRALAVDLDRRGVRVDRVLSGRLARQRDTAAPIAARFGLQVEVDERWDEYSSDSILSSFTGSEVRLEHRVQGAPQMTTREFQDLLEGGLQQWIAAGAGDGGALSYTAFAERIAGALKELAASLSSGQTAVVSTSGGVLAAACVTLWRVAPQAFVGFNRVAINAGVSKIVTGRSGMTLVSFNEHAHLGDGLITYR